MTDLELINKALGSEKLNWENGITSISKQSAFGYTTIVKVIRVCSTSDESKILDIVLNSQLVDVKANDKNNVTTSTYNIKLFKVSSDITYSSNFYKNSTDYVAYIHGSITDSVNLFNAKFDEVLKYEAARKEESVNSVRDEVIKMLK